MNELLQDFLELKDSDTESQDDSEVGEEDAPEYEPVQFDMTATDYDSVLNHSPAWVDALPDTVVSEYNKAVDFN